MLIGSVRIFLDEINFFVLDPETRVSVWNHTEFYISHYQLIPIDSKSVSIIRIVVLDPDKQPELKELGLDVLAGTHVSTANYKVTVKADRWGQILHKIAPQVDAMYYYQGDHDHPTAIAMKIMQSNSVIFVDVGFHEGHFSEEQIAEELAAALRIEPVGMSD